MSQPRARIASQLGIALAAVLAVVITGSTLFALRSLDSANLITRQEHLASEARLLADQLNTFHSTLRDSTQRLSGLFEMEVAVDTFAAADVHRGTGPGDGERHVPQVHFRNEGTSKSSSPRPRSSVTPETPKDSSSERSPRGAEGRSPS